MKRIAQFPRTASAFAVAALLLSTGCSDLPVKPERGPQVSSPAPLVMQSNGLACTEPDAKLTSGALFQVCVNPTKWNRDLVVFIPGYHDPANAPTLPDNFSESPVSLLFTALGYGFATTSFRATGLIEPDTWIGGDLLELVATAETLLVHSTGRTPRYVYQTGGSQGGLGTVQAVERYPNVFSGGLAGCGPIGDYGKQIAYVADFRAVFDYFFAGAIPGWPVWRQDLSANDPGYVDPSSWGTAEQTAGAALDDPGNAGRIRQVLDVTHAPIDPGDPASIKATTLDVLWYSFRFQFTADPAKLAKLQTAARLERPLVTIHTTGDPIVPIWHEALYRDRLPFFSKLLHTPITINRYGHCKFTDAEVLAAFAVLVLKVSGYNLLVSGDVLPGSQEQAEFLRLSRRYGASPVLTPPTSLR